MNPFVLSQRDRESIAARGGDVAQVEAQYRALTAGVHFVCLDRACTLGDGIVSVPAAERRALTDRFEKAVERGRCMKFVPASGAASRMFAGLQRALDRYPGGDPRGADEDADLARFVRSLRQFAFCDELFEALSRHGHDPRQVLEQRRHDLILRYLLGKEGLGFGGAPKALIPFHAYPDGSRTPIQEHMAEAAAYLRNTEGLARLHFTIAPAYEQRIREHVRAVQERFAARGLRFEVGLSCQDPATDAIAVDAEGRPIRTAGGDLLFRPSGHGALLRNLAGLDADIVLIKNIDNVVVDALKPQRYATERMLGGYLLLLEERIFQYLELLDREPVPEAALEDAFRFAAEALWIRPATDPRGWPPGARAEYLRRKLNRPLRVCAVVPSTGEPGGGPFWVRQADGSAALQLVESAQVNMGDARQRAVWASATHFNPVDIVCSLRDYRGNRFDLSRYTAPDTYIITAKIVEGREARVFELPGLWNGSMGDWSTAFVEVAPETFTPVKTVFDLLRREHQGAGRAAVSFLCDVSLAQVITAIRDVHLSLAVQEPPARRDLAGVIGPAGGRLTPAEHLERLLGQNRLSDPETPLMVLSCRNTLSNLRCVAWAHGFTDGVLGVAGEDFRASARSYFVLGQLQGQHTGVTLREIRPGTDDWKQFRWFLSGVPVLWDDWTDDEIFQAMVTEAGDHSHVWRIPRGNHPEATDATRRHWTDMQRLFVEHLGATREEAFAGLAGFARSAGLQREDTYVHHVIGADDSGNLYEMVRRGRPEDVGHAMRATGAKRAICVDNAGATVVQFYPRGARGPCIQRYAAPDHRPAGTAFLVVELENTTFAYGKWV